MVPLALSVAKKCDLPIDKPDRRGTIKSEQLAPSVGGVGKASRSAQAVPDPAQGAGATVPVPALRGQAQAKQPSCISPAQPSANT